MASYLELVWDEFKELTMIVLTIAGIVSLVLGIITDTEGTGMWLSNIVMGVGWIEGFSIILAVLICVNIAAINNYQKEKQFRSLNEENNKAMVKVYVVV